MRGMTREQLQRGVSQLYHSKHPPTLPEFLELCIGQPAMYRPALTNEKDRTPPEEARRMLAKVNALAKTLQEGKGGIQWAYALLERAANGEHVTGLQIEFAKEAIEAFNVTHGNAHALEWAENKLAEQQREPGSDDEPS